MAPPNLKDPAERAAYRRELQGVARGVRYTGVTLALAGAGLALARAQLWPGLPRGIVIAVISLAMVAMAAGLVIRARYHRARMRGQ